MATPDPLSRGILNLRHCVTRSIAGVNLNLKKNCYLIYMLIASETRVGFQKHRFLCDCRIFEIHLSKIPYVFHFN